MRRPHHLVLGFLLFGIGVLPAPSSSSAIPAAEPVAPEPDARLSVETFLDDTGRVDIEALRRSGYEGSLDMKELCTRLNPRTGELIAAPELSGSARLPGDEYWAPGFGAPDPLPGVATADSGGSVACLTIFEGELIVGGYFEFAGGVDAHHLARWDGTSWKEMPSPALEGIQCSIVHGDELFAGGTGGIRRWNGSSWDEVGGGLGGGYPLTVNAMVAHDGDLVVGGNFETAGGMMAPCIARWDGEVWAPVGPGFDGPVTSLGIFNSQLIAGGAFEHSGNTPLNHIARWNGLNWVSLGPGISGGVYALRQYGSALIAGGSFLEAEGDTVMGIARWDGAHWGGLPGDSVDPWSGRSIYTLGERSGRLVVGGDFYEWNGQLAGNIVEWDGTNWYPLDTGFDSSVHCFADFGGSLHGGGSFRTASGAEALRVARWNGSVWLPLAEPPGAGLDGVVYALAAYQGSVVAAGWFYSAGTTPVNNIALWSGSFWAPLGEGLNSYVLALAVHDGDLFAGGGFNAAGGSEALYVARWDGASWHPLGNGMNTVVKTLAICQDDLCAGGFFTRADGQWVNHIARWDGSQWSALGAGIDGVVNALVECDGELVAAGEFNAAGGLPVQNVARWDGSTWSGFPESSWLGALHALAVYQGAIVAGGDYGIYRWTGGDWEQMSWLSSVAALAVHNNWLIAGGDFDATIDPEPTLHNIARWDGRFNWQPLGSGTNNRVEALAPSGLDLFAGGSFSTAGARSARRVARWTDPSVLCGLELLQPTAADTLEGGQTVEIVWSSSGLCSPTVHIDLLRSSHECNQIADETENDGSYTWTVRSCESEPSMHQIRITEIPEGASVESDSILIVPGACASEGYWSGVFDPAGLDDAVLALLPGMEPGQVIAGGAFVQGDGITLNHVGVWDGYGWTPLEQGLNGTVRALAWWQGWLIAGGDFTGPAAGGEAYRVAAWDGYSWQPLGDGFAGPVRALAVSAGDLIAGGDFVQSGSVPIGHIARWNGVAWEPIDGGMNGPVLAIAAGMMQGVQRLIAGGDFTTAGGSPASRVAEMATGDWEPMAEGFDGPVEALSIVMEQFLIAGGAFTMSGIDSMTYLAAWDNEAWGSFNESVNGAVHALCWTGQHLMVGGSFTQAGESACHHIASFDGQLWCRLDAGTDADVRALAPVPDGSGSSLLYAGGDFALAGDRPAYHIGRWNSNPSSCTVDVLQPSAGEMLVVDSPAQVQWSCGGSCGTVVRIELLNSDAVCAVLAEMTENDGLFEWTVTACAGSPEDGYRIRAVDLDTGQNGESGAFSITGDPSSLPGAPGTAIPERTALLPGRPNPAGDRLELVFDLAQPGDVRLEVFDAAGRCVAAFVREDLVPGRYAIPWSGRSQDGAALPSGVYLCMLRAGEVVRTSKILLAR